MSDATLMVFSGNANMALSQGIVKKLNLRLGMARVEKFSDGELAVEIKENVRGKDLFIIQPTCSPANDHLMELLVMADALKRASALRITAVIPYYGYARQDRRTRSERVPITAKLVANLISKSGINRVLTVDLHADQIQGFFNIPVDNIYASPILLDDIRQQKYQNLMVVSPDVGGVIRARALAKCLDNVDLAIIDKRRPKANVSEVMHIIGDVHGRSCIIIDDLVDTAGTLCHAARALKDNGAIKVVAYCTHAVLSGQAAENLKNSVLDELIVTNTIPLNKELSTLKNIRQLSIANMLAETIRRIATSESVSSLYVD
jgi:ribose-phosphate pyrophosphokinase